MLRYSKFKVKSINTISLQLIKKMTTKVLYNYMPFNRALRRFVMQYRTSFILLFQLAVAALSYIASFYLRFEFTMPPEYFRMFYETLPLLVVCRMAAYYVYKIHTGSWLFVSMSDLMDTLKAVLLGSVLFVITMVFVYGLDEFPRSVFILEAVLNLMFLGGSRFTIRYSYEFKQRALPKVRKYALIAGAGSAGVLMLKEVRSNPGMGLQVLGFVDDNPYKKGTNIQGIPILGSIEDIPDLVKRLGIDEVIIAIPSSSYKNLVRITEIARRARVETRILPSLARLIQDDVVANKLRDVSYDDLLGRDVLKFRRESDYRLLKEETGEKSILVTGAGGSIGSELCRQIAHFRPRMLILYERHENSLYDLEIELRKKFPEQHILPVIGDILDSEKLSAILRANKVDLIYHAAAYKHVPMMEREPLEAVRNNILGTLNVARLAVKANVNKFVFISTDKAVNPANVMGATKRVSELVIQGLNGDKVKFIAVRFGNVIGSNGSAIPLFKKQIAEGGPVTVTHPDITRYFMAIPEAVQLVMTAGAMGRGGEIFLLDMGKPVKIIDLAEDLIRRSGLQPGKDIDIVFTGLRPGEKLYEELYWEGEGILTTENRKITMLKPNGHGYDDVFQKIKLLEEYIQKSDMEGTLRLLKEIVPEASIGNGLNA
ncbi:UDP-N-acetylglucosamine 4,6-dehydratase [hydrothermal vent metagenome]|uniref:UDP-N-acetylglucosamine 4,6-dehydratase n=1 Tax=hydrothermal vent metagenome TaxID=652676 RepID=A0A3B1DL97_9ZZZZ